MTDLLVLSTLHQYHRDVACYGFGVLREILVALAPDLVLLEVTDDDLHLRRDEKVKREYPEVVYPLMAQGLLREARALEPSGRQREEILDRFQAAAGQFRASPGYAALERYHQQWLKDLLASWRDPVEVNASETDDRVRAKHDYQNALYPPDYAQAWTDWNACFIDRITEAVGQLRPRLAVALVGLEHSYWLRPRLEARHDMKLPDAAQALHRLLPQGDSRGSRQR
jgi:heme-degrading monooxygenase HmoA